MRHLGEIARKVVDDSGRRAIAHHLDRTSVAADPETTADAFGTAGSVREQLGVSWAHLIASPEAA